jgi:DNA-binding MarR family transcriptional regulator
MMAASRENPDPLLEPQCVADLLLYRLSAVTRTMSRPLVRVFEGQLGITRRQWHVLALVIEHSGVVNPSKANTAVSPSQLVELAGLDRPRISRAVSDLVDKGLVMRAPAQGRQRGLHPVALDRVTELNAALAGALSAAQRKALHAILEQLAERAAHLADELTRRAPPAPRNRRRGVVPARR